MDIEEAVAEPLIEMQTVGFLVAQRKDCVILGMDYIPEQNRYRHVTWIPKVNIIRNVKL